VEQRLTSLNSHLKHYNNQWPHQDRMMEGQKHIQKGLKLVPKKVRS